MPAQSSHQLEQFEDGSKPQLSTFWHVLEQEVPGVRGDLVPLERAVLGVERLHLGGELPGHLGRDFERLSGYRHARKIGIEGGICESAFTKSIISLSPNHVRYANDWSILNS